ncbi:GntR family transcriptional regulator [Salipiger aestuarii]|uniref:GntR family transcriptional regulator n=1 Tax=Salipiger aestuarii TaxID=568098 RepID=UPI00025B84E7|nr:GntR family transcriptional regulator [Salipiger aestuarii]EIE49264.1 transcriptional regulator [Citreicella sp. 357]KAA8606973.1 GntR family transcriptional regulator [Salipiger aestuarii]
MTDRKPAPPRGPAAEQAYQAIRDSIFSGRLGDNARVTEVELAETLSMSRTPVREAVKRLLLEGLLTRDAGPGLRVVALQDDEVAQIFEIRLMLESYAARRAAKHATPEQASELRRLARDMAALVPPRTVADFTAMSELNAAFHQLVLEAARSSRVTAMLSVVVHLALVTRTFRMYREADMQRSARHHIEIADAITAGAPDWAGMAMATHLQSAAEIARAEQTAASDAPTAHDP